MEASLGKKDKPVHLSSGHYSKRISDISSQPTLFYDVEESRGWLVDGASALLHLVRASIHRDSQDPVYQSRWEFDKPLNHHLATQPAAFQTLTDLENLNRVLFRALKQTDGGKMVEAPYHFNQRVQEILDNFELLADYDIDSKYRDGYRFRQTATGIRKTIMGFDFWDLANAERRTWPRAHNLQSNGHGWADYISSIRATTLFGGHFGELLESASPADVCPEWRAVPVGAECLAVSLSTLKLIQKGRPSRGSRPGEITKEITWSSRLELFSPCSCLSTTTAAAAAAAAASASTSMVQSHSHHNPVQLLLPKAWAWRTVLEIPKIHSSISLGDLGDDGAVLFGHTPYKLTRIALDDTISLQTSTAAGTTDSASNLGVPSTKIVTPDSSIGKVDTGPGRASGRGSEEAGPGGKSWFRKLRNMKTRK